MGVILYALKLFKNYAGTLKPLHKRLGFFAFLFGLNTMINGLQDSGCAKENYSIYPQIITIFISIIFMGAIMSIVKFTDKSDGINEIGSKFLAEDSSPISVNVKE